MRARAANTCGWGAWSEPLACSTAPDVPAAPGSLQAKATGTSVRASWGAADDNGAAVQGYELELAGGGGRWAAVFRGDATSHRLQQLQPNATYQLRVRAVNAGGVGWGSRQWDGVLMSAWCGAAVGPPPGELTRTLLPRLAAPATGDELQPWAQARRLF